MTRPTPAAPSFLRSWLVWTAGFLVFPLAGLAGTGVAAAAGEATAGPPPTTYPERARPVRAFPGG